MKIAQLSLVAAALVAPLVAAPGANAFVIGPGSRPGLTVDAAGTAYLAWIGADSTPTLRFCRLPRGATACDAGTAAVIATNPESTSGSRPFVVVSGNRVVVVQYRYPFTGTFRNGLYRYTSTDRGASFGPGELVGSAAFEEAAVGPGDTLSGVTQNGAMLFQNVALNGPAATNPDGTSAVAKAVLSTTHQNQAAVGLIDAGKPLAVFTNSDDAQFRRYTGGDINSISSWTAAAAVGFASYPKLAGGPTGLVLLAGDASGSVFARKWSAGAGDFGPPVTIGPGRAPSTHLFEDAAGRLHAVFQRDNANPLQLVHAISDDGVAWRSGTVATQDIGTGGGIEDVRVATAADHIGVTAWHAGTGAGDIRVAAVGPDAPAPPPPPLQPSPPAAPPASAPPLTPVIKPKPSFTATGSARPTGRRVRIAIKAKLVLPRGIGRAAGCTGRVKFTIKRGSRVIATRTVTIKSNCELTFAATVTRGKVKRAGRLGIRLAFAGNSVLAATTKVGSIKVKK